MFFEFTLLVLKNDNTTTTTNRFGARCYDFVAFVVVDNVYRLHSYVVHCPIKISVLHGSRLYFVQYILFFLPFVCFDLSSDQTEVFRSDAKDRRPPEKAAVFLVVRFLCGR